MVRGTHSGFQQNRVTAQVMSSPSPGVCKAELENQVPGETFQTRDDLTPMQPLPRSVACAFSSPSLPPTVPFGAFPSRRELDGGLSACSFPCSLPENRC